MPERISLKKFLISEYTVFPLSYTANIWIFLSPYPNRVFCDEKFEA